MSRLILSMIKALVGEAIRRTKRIKERELSVVDEVRKKARTEKRGKKWKHKDGRSRFRKGKKKMRERQRSCMLCCRYLLVSHSFLLTSASVLRSVLCLSWF